MKNTGAAFYRFKQQEKYIVKKLDGPKRPSRVECDRQDIPRHANINSQGRTWTF